MGMSRIKINRGHAWGIVNEGLIVDQRLGHAAVRLGCWLSTRPDGWIVHKEHAKAACGLGESSWDGACRQLRKAGYLITEQLRASGKFRGLDWAFNPSPGPDFTGGGLSAPGSAALGSSGDGEPAHLTTTFETTTYKQQQPQQAAPQAAAVVVAEKKKQKTSPKDLKAPQIDTLVFPSCVSTDKKKLIMEVFDGFSACQAQSVLDEVEGRHRQGQVRNPLGLIRHLAALEAASSFVPELASEVAATRQARADHAARMATQMGGQQEPVAAGSADIARQKIRSQIDEMRRVNRAAS